MDGPSGDVLLSVQRPWFAGVALVYLSHITTVQPYDNNNMRIILNNNNNHAAYYCHLVHLSIRRMKPETHFPPQAYWTFRALPVRRSITLITDAGVLPLTGCRSGRKRETVPVGQCPCAR